MKKRLSIALILFLLLSTYTLKNNFSLNFSLNIKEIIIENNSIINTVKIENQLSFLYKTNLFNLQTKKIELSLNEIDFIESFEVKKIFPNKIKIKIFEKKPIAIIQNKKEKKYYTNKGHTTGFSNLEEYKNLPIVFGDQKNFKILHENLKSIDFPIDQIKTFFLFESKRWDIVTNTNQTIKLPIKNYRESLKNFMEIKEQANFEKYKIFDYRIVDQLILK